MKDTDIVVESTATEGSGSCSYEMTVEGKSATDISEVASQDKGEIQEKKSFTEIDIPPKGIPYDGEHIPAPISKTYSGFMFSGLAIIAVVILVAMLQVSDDNPIIYLSGFLVGILLFAKGVLTRQLWFNGKIEECVYRCVSCKEVQHLSVFSLTRQRNAATYKLVCTEAGDPLTPHLFEFELAKDGELIQPGHVVVLYINPNDPKHPVAWRVF